MRQSAPTHRGILYSGAVKTAGASGRATSRQSGPEILRIVLMVMIVGYHFLVYGNDYSYLPPTSPDSFFIHLLLSGGKLGVDGYVLISGYFLVGRRFTIRRLFRVWLPVITFSLAIPLVFAWVQPGSVSGPNWLTAFFPVIFGIWWFATAYVLLYLLSPVLNLLIENLDRRHYAILIVAATLILSVIPTLINREIVGGDLVWFAYLYLLAGFVKLYGMAWAHRWRWGALAVAGLAYLTPAVVLPMYALFPVPVEWQTYLQPGLTTQTRLPMLIAAGGLVLFAVTSKLRPIPAVNYVAGLTFGVYLVHDHYLVRDWLWKTVFVPPPGADGWGLVGFAAGSISVVFLAAAAVEAVRQQLIERPLLTGVSRVKPIRWLPPRLQRWLQPQ